MTPSIAAAALSLAGSRCPGPRERRDWKTVTAGRLTDTIFRINRCGALQPAVAAGSSSERG